MSDLIKNAIPLFVIGVPRSGTTMLARLLSNHPNIVQTYETSAFLLFDNIIKNAEHGYEAGILYGKEYQTLWSKHLASVAKDVIESFYEKIFETEGRDDVRYWGDKHPHHNACLPFIERLYPNALYIYIVRDPRDVAFSIAENRKLSFKQAFDLWGEISKDYEKFQSSVNGDRLYRVQYEHIVKNYEEGISQIMNWLDIEFSLAVREHIRYKQGRDFHNPEKQDTIDFAEKSMERWKARITQEENNYALSHAVDYMIKYNYSIDTLTHPVELNSPALELDLRDKLESAKGWLENIFRKHNTK
ncbi:MAG: sulfotransferase [Methylovulum sp.]|nr:sulfotransferase [Methylovulum sp.]